MNRQSFGVVIGVRHNPGPLVGEARRQIIAKLDSLGMDAVMLGEDEGSNGAVKTRNDAIACAALFQGHRREISGLIVVLPNFGVEIAVADAIELSELHVPVLIQAIDDDFSMLDNCTLRRDSFCGKISVCNNLYYRGIPFTTTTLHTSAIDCPELTADLVRFAGLCRVVNGIRGSRIGMIGTRPNVFNTVRFSERILQKNGIAVQAIDMADLLESAKQVDDESAIAARIAEIKAYAPAVAGIGEEQYRLQAKLGIAVDKAVGELGCDAYALQCWRSVQYSYGCSACLTMSMSGEKGIPAACEGDVTGAVSMLAAQLAAQSAPALMDWDNNIRQERDRCISLHCANFPRSFFASKIILSHQALWKARGEVFFGTVEGQVAQGDMTFFRVTTDDLTGTMKAYVGEGIFEDEPIPAAGGVAACRIEHLQELMQYICQNGFEHHVCFVRGHVADMLEKAFHDYLGIPVYHHR